MTPVRFRALFLSFLLTGGSAWAAAPEIRVAVAQEITTLNPILGSSAVDGFVGTFVYRGDLVVRDGNQSWQPSAAVRVPSVENGDVKLFQEGGRRKMKVVWRIHSGARWGDGTELSASDYRLGWEAGRHENVASGMDRAGLESVERFESTSPKEFSLVYAKPRFDFLRVAPLPLPSHIEGDVFRKFASQKEGYDRNSLYQTDPLRAGLYCGPWVVKELRHGSHLILTRNDFFWGKRATVEKVVIRFLENNQAVENALLTGEVHLANSLGLGLDQAMAIEKRKPEALSVEWAPGAVYEHIVFNLDNPMVSDVRVRKAIAHAVDRVKLVQAVFQGRFPVAHQFLTPRDPWFPGPDVGIPEYSYSPRRATALLDEAGWKMGPGGWRTKRGQRLSLPYLTTSGNKQREMVQVYVQNALKSVGIEAVIRNVPSRVMFGDVLPRRSFEAMVQFARDDWSETSPRSFLGSASVPTQANVFLGENYAGWKNSRVDELLDTLESELELSGRRKAAAQVALEYARELPALPLYFRGGAFVRNRRLSGFSVREGAMGAENWSLTP